MSSVVRSALDDIDKSADAADQIPQSPPPPAYAANAANAMTNSNGTPPVNQTVPRSVIINKLSSEMAASTVTVIPVGVRDSSPLYTVKIDMNSKPNVAFYHGEPTANNLLGEASFTHMSSTMVMYLRGRETKMTVSGVTGDYKVDSPMGECKWSCSIMSSHPNKFKDASGTVLATTTSESRSSGSRRLDTQVQTDSNLLEFLVFSMVACHAYNVMIVHALKGSVGAAS